MRALTFSLLIVVLASIVGLGWALDHLYTRATATEATDVIADYRTLSSDLAFALNISANPSAFVDNWPDHSSVPMALQDRDNFPLPSAMAGGFEQGEPLILESEQGISINFLLPLHQKVLTVSPDIRQRDNLPLLQRLLTTIFYAGILVLMLIWLYPLLRRLKQLRNSAVRFGAGDLKTRINTRGLSYIADIEHEFNNMAQRIQTLVEDNKLLSSAVSHDLRTPLARLRFGVDTLNDAKNPEAKKKYLERINGDLDEMEKLVSSLLNFSRLDHSLTQIDKAPVNISSLIEEIVHQFHDESLHINFISHCHNATIFGSTEYLAMLCNNLIQNASQHAASTINIVVQQKNKAINLEVSDDGPGIPQSQRAEVLKPFTKGQTNISEKNGYGLGLAIVSRIAQWHQAEVNIDQCPALNGARLIVAFDLRRSTTTD